MLFNVDVMVWVWIAVMAITLIVEMSTPVLVSIWFSLGALVAVCAACLGMGITAQIFLFVFVAVAALALARPMARRWLDPYIVPTNADRAVGKEAWVTATVDNTRGEGIVNLEGSDWSAISESGEVLAEGTRVVVREIRGVKLVVSKAE